MTTLDEKLAQLPPPDRSRVEALTERLRAKEAAWHKRRGPSFSTAWWTD